MSEDKIKIKEYTSDYPNLNNSPLIVQHNTRNICDGIIQYTVGEIYAPTENGLQTLSEINNDYDPNDNTHIYQLYNKKDNIQKQETHFINRHKGLDLIKSLYLTNDNGEMYCKKVYKGSGQNVPGAIIKTHKIPQFIGNDSFEKYWKCFNIRLSHQIDSDIKVYGVINDFLIPYREIKLYNSTIKSDDDQTIVFINSMFQFPEYLIRNNKFCVEDISKILIKNNSGEYADVTYVYPEGIMDIDDSIQTNIDMNDYKNGESLSTTLNYFNTIDRQNPVNNQ